MPQNLLPNVGGDGVHSGTKFASWTAGATTLTAPTGTYSATGGPNSTPSLAITATGTSGTQYMQATLATVPADEGFLVLAGIFKSSSTAPTLTPFIVTFKDNASTPNIVVVATPIAAVSSPSASYVPYSAVVGVPFGAYSATVQFGVLTVGSVGGYTVTCAAPEVLVP
jgi:hypothetical protein